MNFKEAFEKLKETKEVEEINSNGNYLLTAAVSILKPSVFLTHEWIFIYYNKKINKTIQVIVSEEGVKIKQEEKPLKPSVLELDVKSIKTNSDKMIEKARKTFEEFHVPLSQVIINLSQADSSPVWKFSFITKTLELIAVELNASNGSLVGKSRKNLTK